MWPNAFTNGQDNTAKYIRFVNDERQDCSRGNYSEDDWISYYEVPFEPRCNSVELGEYTRNSFQDVSRGFGNKIIFESSNLEFCRVWKRS